MNQIYDQRLDQFGQEYADWEGEEVVSLITATGDWLERLVLDPSVVDTVMKTLFVELLKPENVSLASDVAWRTLWADHFDDAQLKASQLFVALNAFAFWGLRPDWEFYGVQGAAGETAIDLIGRLVGMGRALIDAIPEGWGKRGDLDNTILAAEARLGLDAGKDITPPQLAAIARISLKSVKNLLAPGNNVETMKVNPEGKVPAVEAKRWLEARPDFKASVWQLGEVAGAVTPEEEPPLNDVIFVPAAKDGSLFLPSECRTSRGYTIGKKGAEEHIADYLTALDRLSRMPTPYWRRPSAAGSWGIVTGVSWQRRTLNELGLAKEEGA